MLLKDSRTVFCFAAGLLGIALIALGIFLLFFPFCFSFVAIGTIIAGVLLLLVCCLSKCKKNLCWLCLLITLITLFLIISGILTLVLEGLVVGLILIGLGILALLLNVVCLISKLCGKAVLKPAEPDR